MRPITSSLLCIMAVPFTVLMLMLMLMPITSSAVSCDAVNFDCWNPEMPYLVNAFDQTSYQYTCLCCATKSTMLYDGYRCELPHSRCDTDYFKCRIPHTLSARDDGCYCCAKNGECFLAEPLTFKEEEEADPRCAYCREHYPDYSDM